MLFCFLFFTFVCSTSVMSCCLCVLSIRMTCFVIFSTFPCTRQFATQLRHICGTTPCPCCSSWFLPVLFLIAMFLSLHFDCHACFVVGASILIAMLVYHCSFAWQRAHDLFRDFQHFPMYAPVRDTTATHLRHNSLSML